MYSVRSDKKAGLKMALNSVSGKPVTVSLLHLRLIDEKLEFEPFLDAFEEKYRMSLLYKRVYAAFVCWTPVHVRPE